MAKPLTLPLVLMLLLPPMLSALVTVSVRLALLTTMLSPKFRLRFGQETLVLGKQNVGIKAVEPVGQYAVRLVFDDGHDSGLYSWKYLFEIGRDREPMWARYLDRVRAAQAGT